MTTKNFLISLLFIFLITGCFYLYTTKLKNTNPISLSDGATTEDNSFNLTSEVASNYVLPSGNQTYNVSHGKEVTGPKMSQIIFNPLSFGNGATQKIIMTFPEKEVVGSAVVFVTTDTMENQKITFTKDSKTNTWTGEWKPTDTINKRYYVRIYLVGPSGTYDNTMYFL